MKPMIQIIFYFHQTAICKFFCTRFKGTSCALRPWFPTWKLKSPNESQDKSDGCEMINKPGKKYFWYTELWLLFLTFIESFLSFFPKNVYQKEFFTGNQWMKRWWGVFFFVWVRHWLPMVSLVSYSSDYNHHHFLSWMWLAVLKFVN